jgi:hypothetical protein
MGLMMREKVSVIRELGERYRRGGKREKGEVLDEVCKLTKYNRCYASQLLKHPKRGGQKKAGVGRGKAKRVRRRQYDDEVVRALKRIWVIMDCICGKRLAPNLREVIRVLEKWGELEVTVEVGKKLERISASTIDRLLCDERKELMLGSRSRTKPGTLLKSQIPIRTFSEWDDARIGFVEIDLVGHDGGDGSGDFAQTLDATDISSGWTETEAVRNKAQVHVFEALGQIRQRLPFQLLGIDSDNGSEFINGPLLRFCQAEKITFTRSRSGRKNDNCFVEQKNYSVVRRNVGYMRYDSDQEVELLNRLYGRLRLYTNYFQPVMKLISKERAGARVRKSYDIAKTPYQRLVGSPEVSKETKAKLRASYEKLNPAALKREITRLQDELIKVATAKVERPGSRETRAKRSEAHPWRTTWSRKQV